MKVAIYCRVSKKDGSQHIENQLTPLRKWSKRLGGTIVHEFVDEASGNSNNREALKNLFESAHRNEFDVLIVWALDRLSRQGIARMTSYLETLKSKGIKVMSHQEPWLDTSGPISDLLLSVFAWVAQQERTRIQERVKAGLERAKAKGKALGRPRKQVNIAQALTLKASGFTIREISQRMGIKRATLARALQKSLSQKPHEEMAIENQMI